MGWKREESVGNMVVRRESSLVSNPALYTYLPSSRAVAIGWRDLFLSVRSAQVPTVLLYRLAAQAQSALGRSVCREGKHSPPGLPVVKPPVQCCTARVQM